MCLYVNFINFIEFLLQFWSKTVLRIYIMSRENESLQCPETFQGYFMRKMTNELKIYEKRVKNIVKNKLKLQLFERHDGGEKAAEMSSNESPNRWCWLEQNALQQ